MFTAAIDFWRNMELHQKQYGFEPPANSEYFANYAKPDSNIEKARDWRSRGKPVALATA